MVARALPWHDRPWDVQYARNVPLRRLPSKEPKAAASPKSQIREGQVQQRMESYKECEVTDFDSLAAHLALSPELQAEVDHGIRQVLERFAATVAEIEAK